ncbi:uncharacterized protein [Drosophila kikkawai]|uniref:Uncharacterized protein isoform X2 n=1 Tax=Drosophila kikkawai TaxID=30033 RepID=A0ABM3C631_DROKI|nr:uncharacterized protein LOC108083304 isoform X4 [Drosophila kikkawai]
MPISKLPLALTQKLLPSEMCGQDSTLDSRKSANSADIPKMKLLKVNYVHQCREAIINRSNESPQPARLNNPTRFESLCRQFRSPAQIGTACQTGSNILLKNSKSLLAPQAQLRMKTWSAQKSNALLPEPNVDDCSCNNAIISDCNISHIWKYRSSHCEFLHEADGIKSRSDRIARIESTEVNNTLLRPEPPIRNLKAQQHSNPSMSQWMSFDAGQESNSSSKKKTKLERVHIRKKREPLHIINRLVNEKERFSQHHNSQRNYRDKSYDYGVSDDRHHRANPKIWDDSGVCSDNLNNQKQNKQSNLSYNAEQTNGDKSERNASARPRENLTSQIKAIDGDPNDLQNFSKKNLTKVTTNELIQAATENIKQCNIEQERKLINMKVRADECKYNGLWVRETSESKGFNEIINSSRTDPTVLSSNLSMLSSNCGESCLDNNSLCGSEKDCCECYGQQYSTSPLSCLVKDCCNAVGGVFWNNAYNELSPAKSTSCCCSLSSCDEDDCSYFEGSSGDDLNSETVRLESSLSEDLKRNQKTNCAHNLRLMNKEGVSLLTASTDNADQSHNQEDLESLRLKRGHVLTELLETERIYVNEMSSILLGYCDRIKSEELAHLTPPSLQGKEDILFGNLHELFTFHNQIFLKDLENCISTTELVALCFVQRRDTFYHLYSFYCQNIPRSERLRETLVDTHFFFQDCQKRLGHKLPLAAYLLKPVQRITKYQLLLKDLLRFSDSGNCTKELQKALDCMLIVLKCVNDSMHQVAITGFPADIAEQGELLMQDSFQVWSESKKDIRLRIKPQQRHIFLYQKSMLFCKLTSKPGHNKSTYQFKHHVKMSLIGLTETVRSDTKRFEIWTQGRQEVHILQAPTQNVKKQWVAEIKRVLLNQLEELKGEKIKQYSLNHQGLRQTTSWDTTNTILDTPNRALRSDASSETNKRNSNSSSIDFEPTTSSNSVNDLSNKDQLENCGWSSDCSNSEDELSLTEENNSPGSKFIALADYTAMGHSEVSLREGDTIELLKVGCAGWWYVRVLDSCAEGWAPGAYTQSINRKSSQ